MDFFADFEDMLLGDGNDDERCNNTGVDPTVDMTTYSVGAILYVLFGIATIVILLYKKCKAKANIAGMTLAFYICLILFISAGQLG